MSPKDDLASRAKRLQEQRTAAAPAQATPDAAAAPERPPAPRARPVRVTTDLAPQTHRFLAQYASSVAQATGQARVPGSDVIRALIAELETSEHLRAVIQSRLRPGVQ